MVGNKMLFLVGALLLALVITGGVFAYGYTTATTEFNVTTGTADFASITADNASLPAWEPYGQFKGQTGTGTLFTVDTATSGYGGDLVITVAYANAEQLVEAYRVLNLTLEMRDSGDGIVDINGDNQTNSKDIAVLTLGNGSVDLFVTQAAPDTYTIELKSGFYNAHAWGVSGWAGNENPQLYAEVAQR